MNQTTLDPGRVTVYYDGLCPLCSREIEHYRVQEGSDKLAFVDITEPEFDAKQVGLDPLQVHQVMHVRRADGSLATKVDAFITIWNELPRYRVLASLARSKAVRPFLDIGYFGFSKIRPYLPRRKDRCKESPYCEMKR